MSAKPDTRGRRPIVAGNWKMHGTAAEAAALARDTVECARRTPAVDVVVAPPFTSLAAVREVVRDTPVGLAGQNVYPEPWGAFTGEVSPPMLLDAGCAYVIVGHSERRHVMGESDEMTGRKVRAVLDHGLSPILCVGEKIEEREAGRTLDVVERQLAAGLGRLDASALARVLIAYEPVWAIGTGRTARAEDAQQVHAFIRGKLAEAAGVAAAGMRILYGGSVKKDNAAGLFAMNDVDGALVGGASLKIAEFGAIIEAAGSVRGAGGGS